MKPRLDKAVTALQQFANDLKWDAYSIILHQTEIFMLLMQIPFLGFTYSHCRWNTREVWVLCYTPEAKSITFIFLKEIKFSAHVFTPSCPNTILFISYFRCWRAGKVTYAPDGLVAFFSGNMICILSLFPLANLVLWKHCDRQKYLSCLKNKHLVLNAS